VRTRELIPSQLTSVNLYLQNFTFLYYIKLAWWWQNKPKHMSIHIMWQVMCTNKDCFWQCTGTGLFCFLPWRSSTPVGQSLLIVEESWSHSDTQQSVKLLWTSDQPDAETSTWQHRTLTKNKNPCHWQDLNPPIPAIEWSQTHVLDCAASGSWFVCLFLAGQPPVGHGLHIHEISRSHSTTTPQSVGLLWTSD
jgi:hypothetical protein